MLVPGLPMTSDILPAVEIATGARPDAAVILLHGLGDDGHGWSQLVPALRLPRDAAIRFVFPHAPAMPVALNNGIVMPAWYDIRDADLDARADLVGVRASAVRLEALIAREVARGIAPARIVVAGFSQGGAVALYTALRHPARLAAIVALSTYLVDAAHLPTEAAAANRDVPIFMAHGTFDPVVRLAWAERARDVLVAAGYPLEWHAYPMEHDAAPEEITAIGTFLRRVLALG
jgi:phospholipase/carboxylesterase